MSRSWNRQIRIALFANVATLELVRRYPLHVLATQQLSLGSAELPVALARIVTRLQELGWTGELGLTLGNCWFRFAELPWPLQSGNDQHDAELAGGWLTQSLKAGTPNGENQPGIFGWNTILNRARYGQPRLFAALSQENFRALALLDQPAHPLGHWQPWATPAWNSYNLQLPGANGMVGIAEPGMLSLVRYDNGHVQAITQRSTPLGSLEGLLSQLRLEELRLGKPLDVIADPLPAVWQSSLTSVCNVIVPCRGSTPASTTLPSPQVAS